MSSPSGGKCSRCGKILKNGLRYTIRGKTFCFDCHEIEAGRIMQEQTKQQEIYDYLKKTFSINSLASSIVDGIDRCVKDGFTEDNILYTIYYVYKVNNADLDPSFIIANIRRYYKEAIEYKQEQDRILEANKNVEIKSEQVTIKINKSDLDTESRPKFTYNMEDL